MMRALALLLALFVPAVAWAQPGPGAANAGIAQRGSYQELAPRRNKMTMTLGAIQPSKSVTNAGTLYTYQKAFTIEGPAYAVKIGLANPYNGLMSVASASIYFSDSFGDYYLNGTVADFNSGRLHGLPSQNSVYLSCTTVSANATVTCPGGTGTISTGATVYVDGAGISTTGNPTVTVTDGTHVTLSANATASGTATLHFYNLATECRLYFDNSGADLDVVNISGTTRTLSITGTSSSSPAPYTLQWSDLVPCTATPRADGGRGYIAFVYVSLSASTVAFGYAPISEATYNSAVGLGLGARLAFAARPWNNGGSDYADNPTGSNWTMGPGNSTGSNSPALAVAYITASPGWNGLQIGDSLSVSPSDAGAMASPEFVACKTISTVQAPCEFANFAWGAQAWAVYGEAFRRNAAAMQPSYVIGQPMTRNESGGATLANYQAITSQIMSVVNAANRMLPARVALRGSYPFTTTVDSSSSLQAQWTTMRATVAALGVGCSPSTGGTLCPTIPTYNPIPLVSRAALGGNAWDYLGIGGMVANGATAAGATAIAINNYSVNPCYVGDILTDTTTPGALAANAALTTSSATSLGVANTAVIGGGILANDALVCSMPGWAGGALTLDNTHPSLGSELLVQAIVNTFTRQIVGLQ